MDDDDDDTAVAAYMPHGTKSSDKMTDQRTTLASPAADMRSVSVANGVLRFEDAAPKLLRYVLFASTELDLPMMARSRLASGTTAAGLPVPSEDGSARHRR
jgi:hypothetical protein